MCLGMWRSPWVTFRGDYFKYSLNVLVFVTYYRKMAKRFRPFDFIYFVLKRTVIFDSFVHICE